MRPDLTQIDVGNVRPRALAKRRYRAPVLEGEAYRKDERGHTHVLVGTHEVDLTAIVLARVLQLAAGAGILVAGLLLGRWL